MKIDLPRQNIYNVPLMIHLQRDGLARTNPYLISKEFERLGREIVWTTTSSFYVFGSNPKITIDTSCPVGHSVDGRSILDNKMHFKTLLAEAGISVPAGHIFSLEDKKNAKKFYLGFNRPMVIKPTHGNRSLGVTVGIQGEEAFEGAWMRAKRHNTRQERNTNAAILIEEQFTGTEFRFLVVGDQCIGIYHKIKPRVVGNGRDSIDELVRQINAIKAANPAECDKPVILDQNKLSIIKAQGYDPSSIPKSGEVVILDHKQSVSGGAHTVAATDMVHESFKDVAVAAASLADGAPIVGVDMIIADSTLDAKPANYVVLEGNSRPGIVPHHFPSYGKPVNVAGHIAEYCLSKAQDGKVRDKRKTFSVVAASTGGIDRDKVANVLRDCNANIRSISSDDHRLRIYLDEFVAKGVLLSNLLRDALPERDTVVLLEEKRYDDYTVRIVIQGPGTQEPHYPGWLEHQAELRGVRNEVRRLATGDVEAIFSGERVEVGNMIVKCGLGLDPQSGRTVSLWRLDQDRFKPADGRSQARRSGIKLPLRKPEAR